MPPVPPPIKGVTDGTPYLAQPREVTAPDGLRNMFPTDENRRGRLATRPGLVETFGETPSGATPVQCLEVVAQASAQTGYTVGPGTSPSTGSSFVSTSIRGQVAVLDADWSLMRLWNDTRGFPAPAAPPTNAGGYGAFAVCWDPDNDDIAFYATVMRQTDLTTQDVVITGIGRVSLAYPGSFLHTGYVVDANPGYSTPLPASGQERIIVNHMACGRTYLYVLANRYIYVYRKADLTYVKRVEVDFSIEAQCVRLFTTASGHEYLWVGFTGSNAIAGPVVADSANEEAFGEFYRAGFALYRANHGANGASVDVGGVPLTRISIPQGTQNGDAGYEDHRTFRPSEYGVSRPRGCLLYSHAITADGKTLYFGRTNQGWGYNSTQRPDSTAPHITVAKAILDQAIVPSPGAYVAPGVSATYGMSWERDTDSLRRAYTWNGNTWWNDICQIVDGERNPGADSDQSTAPSVQAVALSEAAGVLMAAGRRPAPGIGRANCYGIRADDGAMLWTTDLSGQVHQNAIAVSPVSGNFIVGFNRNSGYEGATAPAELAELHRETGQILRTFDFTDAITHNGWIDGSTRFAGMYGVAVNRRGQILLAMAPFRHDV